MRREQFPNMNDNPPQNNAFDPAQSAPPILRHSVIGPDQFGICYIVYACDHTRELTVAGEASSLAAAEQEAARLNTEQVYKEEVLQMPKRLAAFRKVA